MLVTIIVFSIVLVTIIGCSNMYPTYPHGFVAIIYYLTLTKISHPVLATLTFEENRNICTWRGVHS